MPHPLIFPNTTIQSSFFQLGEENHEKEEKEEEEKIPPVIAGENLLVCQN